MVNSLIKITTIIIISIYLNLFYKTRNIIVILSMTSHGTGVWTVSSNLPSCRLPWMRGVQREPLLSQVPKGSLHNSTCQLNADLPLLGFFVKLKEIHSIRNTAGNLEVRMERGMDGECVSKAMAKSSDPTPPLQIPQFCSDLYSQSSIKLTWARAEDHAIFHLVMHWSRAVVFGIKQQLCNCILVGIHLDLIRDMWLRINQSQCSLCWVRF